MAGQAIDALAIAFHEPVAGVRGTPEQRLDETGVDICVHPRATSLVSRRHRAAIDMLTTTLAWPCPCAERAGGARCETPGLRWAPTSKSPAHATGTRSGWRVTWRRSTLPRMRQSSRPPSARLPVAEYGLSEVIDIAIDGARLGPQRGRHVENRRQRGTRTSPLGSLRLRSALEAGDAILRSAFDQEIGARV